MTNYIVVAEFTFIVNKSFLSSNSKPITVPARCYQGFKQNGLIMESAEATIAFRDSSMVKGNIKIGFRAGGKYYQITLQKAQPNVGLNEVTIGARLFLRILKTPLEWLIEIK